MSVVKTGIRELLENGDFLWAKKEKRDTLEEVYDER